MGEEMRAYWRDRKAANRRERAAAGRCPNHPARVPLPGHIMCVECNTSGAKRRAASRVKTQNAIPEPDEPAAPATPTTE